MPRPEDALLEPARYPFACEIGTRFGDMDANSHINNVALAGLVEETRVRFNTFARLPETLGGNTAMDVSQSHEYLAQAFYPHPVQGSAAVEALGRSSWTMAVLLVQDGRAVVFSRVVLVYVAGGAAAPLAPEMRAAFAGLMLR